MITQSSNHFSALVLLQEMEHAIALRSAETNLARFLVDVLLGKLIIRMFTSHAKLLFLIPIKLEIDNLRTFYISDLAFAVYLCMRHLEVPFPKIVHT